MDKRDFIKKSSSGAFIFPFAGYKIMSGLEAGYNERLSIHIFSKHLQFLDFKSVGEISAEMGFSGVD